MALASCSTEIAHPRSVRIARLPSFVISILLLLPRRILALRSEFRTVNTGQGFEIALACRLSTCSGDLCKKRTLDPEGTSSATSRARERRCRYADLGSDLLHRRRVTLTASWSAGRS